MVALTVPVFTNRQAELSGGTRQGFNHEQLCRLSRLAEELRKERSDHAQASLKSQLDEALQVSIAV